MRTSHHPWRGAHGKTKSNRRQCRSIATASRPTIPDSVVYYAQGMTNGPTGLPTLPWHSRMSTSSHEQQRKQKQERERLRGSHVVEGNKGRRVVPSN